MSSSDKAASRGNSNQFPILTLSEREKDLITRAFISGVLKGEKKKKLKRKAYEFDRKDLFKTFSDT